MNGSIKDYIHDAIATIHCNKIESWMCIRRNHHFWILERPSNISMLWLYQYNIRNLFFRFHHYILSKNGCLVLQDNLIDLKTWNQWCRCKCFSTGLQRC